MPSSTALFGNSASRNQNKNLVEFKAGKMMMKGKMVHPDKRKGLVYLYQSDDSLMHFCWKDRTTGTVEDDLIIFPDDCEFKRIEQCTTGRVYILKFKSSSRKFFFWIQEPKTDKDEENCKKVNEMLNNPPTGSNHCGGSTPDGDLQNLLGSMSQQQLMQLFGSFGSGGGGGGASSGTGTGTSTGSSAAASSNSGASAGANAGLSNLLGTVSKPNQTSGRNATQAATTASTPVTTSSASVDSSARTTASSAASSSSRATSGSAPPNNPIQLSDLQKFLSNLTQPSGAQSTPPPNVDLSNALNSESIAGVLNDPNLVKELSPHLPNTGGSESTEEQLLSTIRSPQFQQAVSMFSAALQSGQLGPVVQQFQVGENAVNAANQGNMEEFVKALQNTSLNQDRNEKEDEAKHVEKKKKTEKDENDKNDKKDDDDDKMALD